MSRQKDVSADRRAHLRITETIEPAIIKKMHDAEAKPQSDGDGAELQDCDREPMPAEPGAIDKQQREQGRPGEHQPERERRCRSAAAMARVDMARQPDRY